MTTGAGSTYSGRCACGAVTYEVLGPPIVVAQCHCEDCRRISGTGHTIGALFSWKDLTLNGTIGEFRYLSGRGSEVTKGFCPACGSPIFGTNTMSPGYVTLSLGTMNDATDLAVQVVVFARDRPHWDRLGDDVVSFATQPDWHPER